MARMVDREARDIAAERIEGRDDGGLGMDGERRGQQVSLDRECGMRGRVVSSGIRQDYEYGKKTRKA